MPKFLLLFVLTIPVPLYAADVDELHVLREQCAKEQSASFSDHIETPSCDKLKKITSKHSAKTANSAGFTSPNLAPKHNDAASYHWSGTYGKYCYFNENGDVSTCP